MTHLPALTGVRGAAALLVLLFHSKGVLYRSTGLEDLALLEMGWFGVDIFFLLSGFILSHVHFQDFEFFRWKATRNFILLRLSRIYPVHLFSLLVVVAFFFLTVALGKPMEGRQRFAPDLFVGNLFLIQSWGWAKNDSWNVLSWSISTEWFMYLWFPAIAVFLTRLRMGVGGLILAGTSIGVMVLILYALGLPSIFTSYQWGIIRTFGSFLAGCFLCVAYRSGRLINWPWAWIELLCVTWLVVAIIGWRSAAAALPAAGGLICALAMGRSAVSRFMASQPMFFLGDISYSLYMMHMITIEICFLPVSYTRLSTMSGPFLLAWYAVSLGVVAFVTLWTHKHVEKPARAWLRNLLDR